MICDNCKRESDYGVKTFDQIHVDSKYIQKLSKSYKFLCSHCFKVNESKVNMKMLIALLMVPFLVYPCCCFKKKPVAKPVVVEKKQEHKEKESADQLHSFVKEVTNVDVAKADLKTELRDVAETLTAIGINEGTKLVAKTAIAAVI